MKFYEAEADIRSTPDVLWKLLTNASDYPRWNTTIDRVEGDIAPGRPIKVFVKVNPAAPSR